MKMFKNDGIFWFYNNNLYLQMSLPQSERETGNYRGKGRTVEAIKQAIESGAETYRELAKLVGISVGHTYTLVSQEEISFKPKNETQRKIEAINKAINEGAIYNRDIAEIVGISPYYVSSLINSKGSGIPSAKERKLNAINRAICEGATTTQGIATKAGLPIDTVYRLISESDIDIVRKHIREQRRIELINQALVEGESSLENLCRIVDFSPHSLWLFSKKHGMDIPYDQLEPYPLTPEFHSLIQQGLTLEAIGQVIGVSGERIRQRLRSTGWHKFWQDSKRHQKILSENLQYEARTNFVAFLNVYVDEKAKEKGWAHQKAVEYIRSFTSISASRGQRKRLGRPNLDYIVTIFERYEEAQRSGKPLSLEQIGEQLGEDLNLYPSEVSGILKRVGLEPLYGSRERHITPQYKKDAMKRTFDSDMTISDVAHFLELPYYVVISYFRRIGKRKRRTPLVDPEGLLITYSLLSQIYDAKDIGFKPEEMSELFDTSPNKVRYAFKHRETLAPRVIASLQILFPSETIDTPYLNLKIINT